MNYTEHFDSVPIWKNIDLIHLYECRPDQLGVYIDDIPASNPLWLYLQAIEPNNTAECLQLEIARSASVSASDKLALLTILDLVQSEDDIAATHQAISQGEGTLRNRTVWSGIIEEQLAKAYQRKCNFLVAARLFDQASESFEQLGARKRALRNALWSLESKKKASPALCQIEPAQNLVKRALKAADDSTLASTYLFLSNETLFLGLAAAAENYADQALELISARSLGANLLGVARHTKIRSLVAQRRTEEARAFATAEEASESIYQTSENNELFTSDESGILSKIVLGLPVESTEQSTLESLIERNVVQRNGREYRYSLSRPSKFVT